MATKTAQKRLTKEFVAMQQDPPPYVWAMPEEKNILTWNFLIRGPPDSPFAGGEYHGVLLFPPEYPFKPPGIKMFTPSGRFYPDKKICFSMSDFHPASWNPAWSVATILTGLLSFMLSDEMTTGSVTTTDAYKRNAAAKSHRFNLESSKFKEAFPDYCTFLMRDLPNMGQKDRGKPDILEDAGKGAVVRPNSNADDPARNGAPAAPASPTTWRQLLYEKWRLCAFIALAVIVSRFSSRG
ncbi:hypothetical protein M413DRAFT_244583 [Hebeloma cylindrosporum]|uniref:Ubiquitin-conjugating enzyme E2 6 n=1 Tax=Hebeloma cylindrosporum TaxID=76867 RepID=A0A0C3C402_HEBCY|nr:hypothetical protein M413DRAFT_244583 [Hebeloma cylindrosporum h7]